MLTSARFTAILAIAAVALMPATARAQGCEDLVLGAALSATGIYASNGANTKNGYEFAAKKINDAGGVKIGGKCYHLKITYYDDESTPARAAQLVDHDRRLFDLVARQLGHSPAVRGAAGLRGPLGNRLGAVQNRRQ